METKRGFLWQAAVGNQAANQIDQEIHWTAMARVLDLHDIFELVNYSLDNRPLSQQNLIEDRLEFVFHVRFDSNNGLKVEIAQEFFKKWSRVVKNLQRLYIKLLAVWFPRRCLALPLRTLVFMEAQITARPSR